MVCITSNVSHARRRVHRRRGVALSVELVMALPILLAVLFAIVEFGLLLQSNQGVIVAASFGSREAALPGADYASVVNAVDQATQGYKWQLQTEVAIYVNGVKDTGSNDLLQNAVTGDVVLVTVSLPMEHGAPDALKFVGYTLVGRELTSTFVTRRE
jgi:Flp pilus assembly protein TadG